MQATAATRPGRGHRKHGLPCQDAYHIETVPARGIVFAVADGLGSKPHSQRGAQVAARAAVERLVDEPHWKIRAMLRAIRAARRALRLAAAEMGVPVSDMATTLQLGVLGPDGAVAAMVGDGGMVAGRGAPNVLLAPGTGGYANEVTPVTSPWWRFQVQYAEHADATWMMGFSDGLTRLLLAKQEHGWAPYSPFFESFLPHLESDPLDANLAQRFLDAEHVDASWDDDKCLVAVRHV